MKSPAFLLYTGDFLSSPDVQLMEAHEVGAYCLLLFNSWQSDRPGFLPNDEGRLRRTARLSVAQWADSRDLLLSKFPLTIDGSARYNPRLVAEAAKQLQHREAKARAGQASAAKRAAKPTRVASKSTPVEHVLPETATMPSPKTSIPTGVAAQPTRVSHAVNTCSENGQHTGNLSLSISIPSSLRSEGEGPTAPPSPAPPSKKKSSDFPPHRVRSGAPPLSEIQAYATDQHPGNADAQAEAAAFFDHFQSNGWRVGGKTPMVDWRAAFRNWMRRRAQFASPTPVSATPTRARTAPKPADPTRWS